MKKFYHPFSPSILHTTECRVSNHDEIRNWILNMYSQSSVKDEGNFYNTGFTTYFYDDFTSHLDSISVFDELKNIILIEATTYVGNAMGQMAAHGEIAFYNKPLEFSKMWFNINPPGGYQGRHHHAMNLLGGTYYIDVPKDSGKIGFYNPNPFAYYHNQDLPSKHLLFPDYDIQPQAGDLLIWPGWMDHEIAVNKTKNENRITVSFGINWGN